MTEYTKIYQDALVDPKNLRIRLLTISPGSNEGIDFEQELDDNEEREIAKDTLTQEVNAVDATDIAVQLKTYALDKCPEYEALSYTWGEPTGRRFLVQCDGYNFLALWHLRNALLALRLPDRPRTVWIDAVCINQDNRLEREHQVTLMQHIYRKSKRAIVWLGLDIEENYAPAFQSDANTYGLEHAVFENFVPELESSLAFYLDKLAVEPEQVWRKQVEVQAAWEKRRRLIQDTAIRLRNAWASRSPGAIHTTDLGTALAKLIPEEMPTMMRKAATYLANRPRFKDRVLESIVVSGSWQITLRNILCREWWSRVWIIQEACVAPEVTFMCGDFMFDLDLIFLGMVLYTTATPDPRYHGHISAAWSLLQIMEYRTMQQSDNHSDLPNLLHLLQEFRPAFASDSKDHVYGLLGLLRHDELEALHNVGFKVVYDDEGTDSNITTAMTFIETAKAICLVTQNLDILSIAHPLDQSETASIVKYMPSWVPNWANRMVDLLSPTHGIYASNESTMFSACGRDRTYIPHFREGKILVLSGYIADIVADVVARPFQTVTNLMEDMNQLVEEEDRLAEAQAGNELGFGTFFVEFMGRAGKIMSVLFEWENFAQKDHRKYPTGEEMSRVICAVRCFGYLPRGPEDAVALFEDYMNALSLCRRIYNLAVSPARLSLTSRKCEEAEEASPSKLRQSLLAIFGPRKKKKARMNKFNALQKYSIGRKLAWTQNGFLALVPARTQVGDQIVLCKGSKLPLVMRPSEVANQWQLLDACYVHGVMQGEIWDEQRCSEMELI